MAVHSTRRVGVSDTGFGAPVHSVRADPDATYERAKGPAAAGPTPSHTCEHDGGELFPALEQRNSYKPTHRPEAWQGRLVAGPE
jgi:hypothetical protein